MNTRAFTLALVIAIFSSFMVYTYIEDEKKNLVDKYGTNVSVVVAKQNISELELIDDSKVTIRTMPSSFVAPKSFRAISEVENTVASVPIIKGEQLTEPRVVYPDSKTGLSRQVSVGKRAVSIPVKRNEAVANLIKPGDRVDVLVALDYSGGKKDMQKTTTVLQDVLVLSTGQKMTNNLPLLGKEYPKVIKKMNLNTVTDFNSVTLELDPFQSQKLFHIKSFGGYGFYLTLRNNSDKEKVRIQSTSLFDVLGEEESARAKQYFIEKQAREQTGR